MSKESLQSASAASSLSVEARAYLWLVCARHFGHEGYWIDSLPESQQVAAKSMIADLAKFEPSHVRRACLIELAKIETRRQQNYANDVHPDWLLADLLQETPAMIALAIRYLPTDVARQIVEGLPPEIVRRLPHMSHTFAIPVALVKALREQFVARYDYPFHVPSIKQTDLACVALFNPDQLDQFFCTLGYLEVAMAVCMLPETTQTMILNRIDVQDRKHVRAHMARAEKAVDSRLKLAQAHLAGIKLTDGHGTELARELGSIVFAKTVLLKDLPVVEVIYKKMPKRRVLALAKLVDQHAGTNSDASVTGYREDILIAVKTVMRAPESVHTQSGRDGSI